MVISFLMCSFGVYYGETFANGDIWETNMKQRSSAVVGEGKGMPAWAQRLKCWAIRIGKFELCSRTKGEMRRRDRR